VATAITRAEKLLSLVDLPGATVVNTGIALLHLPVAQARTQLTEHLAALEKAATGESGRSRLIVLSDERLNSLELYGPQDEVKRAEEYLKRVDRELPPSRRTIRYYKLMNVPVVDVADSIRQLLGIAIAARDAEEAKPAPPTPQAPIPGRPPLELAGRPAAPGQPPPPPQADPARKAPKPATPAGAAPADVEVVALESQNILVVTGSKEVHEEVARILEHLDKRKGQVLIEVAIMQVTGDDSLDFGVEFLKESVKKDGTTHNYGTGYGLGQQASTTGTGFPNVLNLSSFAGTAFRYLKPDEVSVLVKALSTKSNVNILSQPLLLVNDNENADFTTKVSEPTVAVSQGTVGNITSFAGFAEAVTSLRITPQIAAGGYLNLKITQNFEEFTGS
ncbi:MAG: secretin N-terminal domain-containing protein, partial [Vicinamibacteria bacterium]